MSFARHACAILVQLMDSALRQKCVHLRLQERLRPDSRRVHARQLELQEQLVPYTPRDPRNGQGRDLLAYYMVLNAKKTQILTGQFLHISGQIMRGHYRDNGDIDVGCRVRQIVDYMSRRLDMQATVEVTETVAAANMGG